MNLAAFTRYWARADGKRPVDFILALLGFLISLYLWLSLRTPAKIGGGLWLGAGVLYGAIKTRGFRGDLVSFEAQ